MAKRLSFEATVPVSGGTLSVGINVPDVESMDPIDAAFVRDLLNDLCRRAQESIPENPF